MVNSPNDSRAHLLGLSLSLMGVAVITILMLIVGMDKISYYAFQLFLWLLAP